MDRRGGGDVPRVPSEATPEFWLCSNGCDESKGHKAQEGRQSRERPAKLFAWDTLKWRFVGRLRPGNQPQEGRAGGWPVQRKKRENPEGLKTQESYALSFGLNRRAGWRTVALSKTLKVLRTPRGEWRWKQRTAAREEESSEGWPQERIRHGTRPAGSGRMKAPGGCEHLKAQAVGKSRPNQFMPLLRVGKALKGSKPQGRRCRLVLGSHRVSGFPGKPGALCGGSVLGHPLKGSRSPWEEPEDKSIVLGGLEREDPGARPMTVKGMRGAPKQWRR